eukprot:1996070-Rhodomonas_salina.1
MTLTDCDTKQCGLARQIHSGLAGEENDFRVPCHLGTEDSKAWYKCFNSSRGRSLAALGLLYGYPGWLFPGYPGTRGISKFYHDMLPGYPFPGQRGTVEKIVQLLVAIRREQITLRTSAHRRKGEFKCNSCLLALRTLTQPLPSSLLLPLQLLPLALLPPYPFFLHREVTFKNISASFCPNSSHLVPPVPPARCQALCSLCGARLGAAEARGRTRAAGKRHKKIKDSIEEQSQRFPPGLVRGASPRAVSEAGVWAL